MVRMEMKMKLKKYLGILTLGLLLFFVLFGGSEQAVATDIDHKFQKEAN